jgi:ferredoxin-NADP reductase
MYFTVTRSPDAGWTGRRGRIDRSLLENALPSVKSHCLICGPQQLVNDARALLAALGVDESRLLVEKF